MEHVGTFFWLLFLKLDTLGLSNFRMDYNDFYILYISIRGDQCFHQGSSWFKNLVCPYKPCWQLFIDSIYSFLEIFISSHLELGSSTWIRLATHDSYPTHWISIDPDICCTNFVRRNRYLCYKGLWFDPCIGPFCCQSEILCDDISFFEPGRLSDHCMIFNDF